jgi:hypothetical protein
MAGGRLAQELTRRGGFVPVIAILGLLVWAIAAPAADAAPANQVTVAAVRSPAAQKQAQMASRLALSGAAHSAPTRRPAGRVTCTVISSYVAITASQAFPCVTVEDGGTLAVVNTGGCGTGYPTITLTLENGGAVDAGGMIGLFTSNNCDEGGDSILDIAHGTLDNAGTIIGAWCTNPGGSPDNCGGNRYIEGNVTNTGSVEVTDVDFFEDGMFHNSGELSVYAGGVCPSQCVADIADGESFVNATKGSIVDQTESGQVSGSFSMSGGTFSEAGTTSGPGISLSGVTLDYTGKGASGLVVTGTSTLEGTSVAGQTLEPQGGSDLALSAPDGFTNGGVIDFDSGSDEATFTIGSGQTLTNEGTVEEGCSPGPAEFTTIEGPGDFDNDGTIAVGCGVLTLDTLDNLSARTLSGGAYVATGNAQMQLPGSVRTLAASIDQEDSANFEGALSSLTTIGPGGSLALTGGADLSVSSGLGNAGVISLGTNDTLDVSGPYKQAASGTIDDGVAGAAAGSTYGQLQVNGEATFAGTLIVSKASSYEPAKGSTQQVLTYSSKSGRFTSVEGTTAGSGRYFVLQYTDSAAELVVNATTLKVSPHSGAPGSTVTLTGKGFSPGETITVSFRDHAGHLTTRSAAMAGSSGGFTVVETVPSGAAGGAGEFRASGRISEVTAHCDFSVT